MATAFDPASVRACVFDVFGTVVDWRGSIVREGRERWSERLPGVDWAQVADAWRDRYAPMMEKVRTGALPWTALDALHRMILDEIAPRFGLDTLSEDETQDLNRVWHRLHGWPDARDGIARIRKHRIVATLSNGNVALLTNMAKFAGIAWDTVLSAELFRHYKPDPEVYLGAASLLGLEPRDVMMCAAHRSDLDTAARLGLRTGYIHRPLEYPGGDMPMPVRGDYDIVATGIDGIADALGS